MFLLAQNPPLGELLFTKLQFNDKIKTAANRGFTSKQQERKSAYTVQRFEMV